MLVSAGSDGAVYSWSVRELKRESEHILKNCNYTCAVASSDGKTVWAVGSDRILKEISDSVVTREIDYAINLSQIIMSNSGRMMFAATQSGTLRSLKFPLPSDGSEFAEHQAHTGSISKLRLSYDDQYLFSAGEDGCLYVYKVTDKEDRATGKKERIMVISEEVRRVLGVIFLSTRH